MDLITINRRAGLEFEIGVRRHRVTTDMSPADGGRDAGASPAELMAASLGACIAMQLQAHCDTRGYGDVTVSLTLELGEDPKRINTIVADVEVAGRVPEGQLTELKRVAEQALIHETLRNPPRLEIEITLEGNAAFRPDASRADAQAQNGGF